MSSEKRSPWEHKTAAGDAFIDILLILLYVLMILVGFGIVAVVILIRWLR